MEEKETLIEKITNWWWDNIGWKIRDIYRSIRSVIKWFPVIWNDRDWDDWYIYKILQTKLKFQSKYIGDRDIHTRAKRDAEVMNTCVRLIDKLMEDFYDMEYLDYHESTFSFVDSDKPDYKRLEITDTSENFDEFFKKYPLVYKKVLKDGDKNIFSLYEDGVLSKKRIAMNISQINHDRARKLLFNVMGDNINRWWD
jgi:hypothetical protein